MNRSTKWMLGAATGTGILFLPVAFVARMATSQPAHQPQPLPTDALALESETGERLLSDAAVADLRPLLDAFQTQQKGAWCGVASSVAVLNARGAQLTQAGLFTPEASAVRSWWRVTFGGMPLPALAGLLRAHGASATVHHADAESVESFRAELARNLASPGDYVIVNYDRRVMDEAGGGHISPLAALSADGKQALLLDTASYKYPPHWVSVERLFAAMDTPDSETGQSRGWVVVR